MPSLGSLPFTSFFQDNREYSYFLYFQEESASDISEPFDGRLWNSVILQASWNEPSLCRLVAAIGALNKANGLGASNLSEDEMGSHQQYALRQYGRALKGIQAMVSTNQHGGTTRIALIASLLIYCFENLYGELDSAIAHLESALQLMHKQLAHSSRRYRHSQNKSPTVALEDDLVAAFVRLDNGLLSRIEKSKTENVGSGFARPSILRIDYPEDICDVPDRFGTIFEARNYLEHFQFRALPRLSYDFALQMKGEPSSGTIDEKSRDMYTMMSAQLHQWGVAFAPIYAETLKLNGNKNFVAAATLRIRALSTDLAARRVLERGMSSPDLLIPESREIVGLSKWVVADPGFIKSFVWDCGIIPGLSIVIGACLNIGVQEEALQVLKQTVPRREGVWDSFTAVKNGEKWLQLQRRGQEVSSRKCI